MQETKPTSQDSADKANSQHGKILEALRSRVSWEDRQRIFYEMRHNGLRRRNKPWPGASDLHFPLADTHIDKLKPFYFQQIYAQDLVASFVAHDDIGGAEGDAEVYFDYTLKNRTNLEDESLVWIDNMLMTGKSVVKIYWDVDCKKLCFDAINPLFIIVPISTKKLEDADWVVQVYELTEQQYKLLAKGSGWKVDDGFLKSIKGSSDTAATDGRNPALDQAKVQREGLTYSKSADSIIVWEVYTRNESGDWVIDTYSPRKPDTAIKAQYGLPYQHGKLPYVEFQMEVKDKGYFSSRGVVELDAPFETSLCKLWNEKHDTMTFANRPMFTAGNEISNTANIRMMPGQVLPSGLSPVQMPPPPISFDQEMISTRQTSEQRIGIPDYATGESINTDQRRTATEITQVGQRAAQSDDLRARIFRASLTKLYRQSWSLLMQYDSDGKFLRDGTFTTIDNKLKSARFEIAPSGSSDSWNRPQLLQRAVTRKQLLGNSPFINQSELDKSILELDDPQLVKRLFQDPNERQADQVESQAEEILLLEKGFPVRVKAFDDDAIHIMVCAQYLANKALSQAPETPQEIQAISQHIAAHQQALQKKNPKALVAVMHQLKQMDAQVQQTLASQPQPPNVMPMQPGAPQQQGAPAAQKPVSVSVSAKLGDFAPAERAQIIAKDFGIQPAQPGEMAAHTAGGQ